MDGNAWRDLVTGKTSEQAMPFLETGNPIYAIAFGIKGDHRGQDTVYLASMAFYSTPDFTPSNAPELLAYMAATDMDPGRMAQAHDWRNAQPVESPDSFITDPSCPMRLGYLFRETEARVWAWHRKYTEDCPCGFPWVCELGIFVREVDTDTVRKILANGPEGVAAIVPDAL